MRISLRRMTILCILISSIILICFELPILLLLNELLLLIYSIFFLSLWIIIPFCFILFLLLLSLFSSAFSYIFLIRRIVISIFIEVLIIWLFCYSNRRHWFESSRWLTYSSLIWRHFHLFLLILVLFLPFFVFLRLLLLLGMLPVIIRWFIIIIIICWVWRCPYWRLRLSLMLWLFQLLWCLTWERLWFARGSIYSILLLIVLLLWLWFRIHLTLGFKRGSSNIAVAFTLYFDRWD